PLERRRAEAVGTGPQVETETRQVDRRLSPLLFEARRGNRLGISAAVKRGEEVNEAPHAPTPDTRRGTRAPRTARSGHVPRDPLGRPAPPASRRRAGRIRAGSPKAPRSPRRNTARGSS